MDVVVQYFDGCPNWELARDRLSTVLDEETETVRFETIDTVEKAEAAGFCGSPTILLDGVDPFADATVEGCVDSVAELHDDAYEAVAGCDAAVIATEHSEFRKLDLKRLGERMRSLVLIDGRNLLDPEAARDAGFTYVGIGRGRRGG